MTTVVTVDINTGVRTERPMTPQEIAAANQASAQEKADLAQEKARLESVDNLELKEKAFLKALEALGVVNPATFRQAFANEMRKLLQANGR